jgi:hypothetical protein
MIEEEEEEDKGLRESRGKKYKRKKKSELCHMHTVEFITNNT